MEGESIGENNNVGKVSDVYRGSTEPVLVLLSDLYSDDDEISVCNSRSFSYPAYTATDYFVLPTTALKKNVCYVILRRMFYSSQLF